MMGKLNSLRNNISNLFLKVARWRALRPVVTFLFKHMLDFIPIDRLEENDHWMAIRHPQPDYPLHILLLSKDPIDSLTTAPKDTPEIYADLFQLVTLLIKRFGLEKNGYRLIFNGGPHQKVPRWHAHLISEHTDNGDTLD